MIIEFTSPYRGIDTVAKFYDEDTLVGDSDGYAVTEVSPCLYQIDVGTDLDTELYATLRVVLTTPSSVGYITVTTTPILRVRDNYDDYARLAYDLITDRNPLTLVERDLKVTGPLTLVQGDVFAVGSGLLVFEGYEGIASASFRIFDTENDQTIIDVDAVEDASFAFEVNLRPGTDYEYSLIITYVDGQKTVARNTITVLQEHPPIDS